MIELDDCTIAVEALECIDNYLKSFDETSQHASFVAISTISGIIRFAHHLSNMSHGLAIISNLREENE